MPPESALATESDAALLARVAARGAEARAAESELYKRHVRFLFGVLNRRRRDLLSSAGLSPEDLVQETFQRAFERAGTFRPSEEALTAERDTARTRAWLGRVATNLLADHLARLREVSASPYIDRLSSDDLEETPSSERSGKVALVTEGLEALTERERDVLRVTALYQRAGEEQGRLPNAVSQDLSTRWQTTNDNIRAIRVRAMKKLKAFLSSRGMELGGARTAGGSPDSREGAT
jgi:RNA polymerase sigma factor (sigma-70 family)